MGKGLSQKMDTQLVSVDVQRSARQGATCEIIDAGSGQSMGMRQDNNDIVCF
jgi:hypothetical protein